MQSTFFDIHSSAMDFVKGLDRPDQQEAYGAILRAGIERFFAVAKGVIGTDTGDSLEEEDTGDDKPHNGDRPRSRDDGGPASGGATNISVPLWGDYHITYGRDSQQETYDTPQGGPTSSSRETYETPAEDPADNLFYQNFNPFPTIRQELDPVSYSFQETSFSRRLHRACLENAHNLLSSPSTSQHELSKTFAHTSCYATREEILTTITRLLRGGTTDPLNAPAIADCSEPGHFAANEEYNKSLRASEGRKQLAKLGITNKFLNPAEVEQRLVEKGLQAEIDASNASDHAGSPASSQDLGYHSSSNGSMDSTTNCCDVDMDTNFSATKAGDEAMRTQPAIEGAKRVVDMDVLVKGSLPPPPPLIRKY